MKAQRSPQEKKARAYREDHVVPAEYPHAFRRQWPRKKAYANRAYRHHIRQLLHSVRAVADTEGDRAPDVRVADVRRRSVRNWGAITLAERVRDRQQVRTERTAWNFFRGEYTLDHDRDRFIAFLTAITSDSRPTPHVSRLARFFGALLDTPRNTPLDRRVFNGMARRRTWLRAFLSDAPEWEPRLRTWTTCVLEGEQLGGQRIDTGMRWCELEPEGGSAHGRFALR